MQPYRIAAAALLCAATAHAAEPFDIAVTVDDLPVHGALPPGATRTGIVAAHVAAFKAHGVPEAFGFVNAGRLARESDAAAALDAWRAAGHPLGNHGFEHVGLSKAASLAAWQADVTTGEPAIAARMAGQDWHWFRYPFLDGGNSPALRADALAWLAQRGYRIAAVSVSFDDWAYTEAYARCASQGNDAAIGAMQAHYLRHVDAEIARMKSTSRQVYGRVIPQVLLTHVGAWSAATLPAVLDRLDAAGARYVTLAQAQADPAYAGAAGGVVTERAAAAQGMTLPAAVVDRSIDLDGICR